MRNIISTYYRYAEWKFPACQTVTEKEISGSKGYPSLFYSFPPLSLCPPCHPTWNSYFLAQSRFRYSFSWHVQYGTKYVRDIPKFSVPGRPRQGGRTRGFTHGKGEGQEGKKYQVFEMTGTEPLFSLYYDPEPWKDIKSTPSREGRHQLAEITNNGSLVTADLIIAMVTKHECTYVIHYITYIFLFRKRITQYRIMYYCYVHIPLEFKWRNNYIDIQNTNVWYLL